MRRLSSVVAIAVAGLTLTLGAASASATTTDVACTDNATADQLVLQPALNAANAGDTIVISGLCAGSYEIPKGSAFTIEGAAGQTDGFDGQSTQQSDTLLYGSVGAMTLENLTFENAVEPDGDGPSALYIQIGPGGSLTLSGDDFTGNSDLDSSPEEIDDDSNTDGEGCSLSPASIAISDSQFTNNTLNQDGSDPYDLIYGGAGLSLYLTCESDSVSLTGNTFSGNVISNEPSTNQPGTGAGLSIFADTPDGSDDLVPVMQSNNTFSANAIDAPADDTVDFFDGAGEAAMGVALQSQNDKFIDNVLPGSDPETGFYWGSSGAGLFLGGTCGGTPQATLQQDVVGDNVITMSSTSGDSAAAANGAGIAIGEDPVLDYYYDLGDYYGDEGYYFLWAESYEFLCGEDYFGPANAQLATGPADSADLNLNDSTVTGNAVIDDGSPAASDSGAVAGIDAPDGGSLELDNTILNGDVGGSEADGFTDEDEGSASGSTQSYGIANPADSQITATYSDFCDPNNPSSPFMGTGNICADPELVTDGYSAPSDLGSVGENAGSAGPVIDSGTAGSSSTQPNMEETSSSPTIDAGSNALVPNGITTDIYGNQRELAKSCPVGAGTVDIGAAEYVPTCTTSTPPSAPTPTPTPAPTPAPTPQPSKVVQACASLRDIVMHLQYTFFLSSPDLIRSASATLTSTTVAGFGTRQLTIFGPYHNELRLNLRTLPFGTYFVHAHVTLTNGEQASQVREWHTCRPFQWHYKPGKPRKIHWHS